MRINQLPVSPFLRLRLRGALDGLWVVFVLILEGGRVRSVHTFVPSLGRICDCFLCRTTECRPPFLSFIANGRSTAADEKLIDLL